MRIGLALFVVTLLGGCAHRANPRLVHEKDPAQCAAVIEGRVLHATLERTRADGTCDVWWWAN